MLRKTGKEDKITLPERQWHFRFKDCKKNLPFYTALLLSSYTSSLVERLLYMYIQPASSRLFLHKNVHAQGIWRFPYQEHQHVPGGQPRPLHPGADETGPLR